MNPASWLGIPPRDGGSGRTTVLVALYVLAAGVLLRFLFLSADPAYYAWAGYITDEGRWTRQARELVLFGSLDLRLWLSFTHLVLAPLYEAATWMSFSIFGVGLGSARLVSALGGSLLLVALWHFLRRHLTPEGLLLAVVCVALQRDLIFLSRVAIPEMVALLFEFIAFGLLVLGPPTPRRAFFAGVTAAVAFGFKGTGLVILPIFAAVVLVTPRPAAWSGRLSKLGAFLGGVLAPAVAVFVLATTLTDIDFVRRLDSVWPGLTRFMRPDSAYSAATLLFYGDYTAAINVLLLGAWLVGGLLLFAGRIPPGPVRDIYVGSGVWVIGWLLLAAALEYFPERYVFRAIVPLAVHLGAGVSLLQVQGSDRIMGSLENARGAARIVQRTWLSIPAAVVLCVVVVNVLAASGVPVERFTHRLSIIAMLVLSVAIPAVRARRPWDLVLVLCVAPSILTLLWLFYDAVTPEPLGFWPAAAGPGLLGWGALVVASGILGLVAMGRGRERGAFGLALPAAGALAVLGLLHVVPGAVSPTYTLRDAGRELGRTLAGVDVVWTNRAATAFLANGLEYQEAIEGGAPGAIVSIFSGAPQRPNVSYSLADQYEIRLGEEYLARQPRDPMLRVYRRIR